MKTHICIANGPSLTKEDVEAVHEYWHENDDVKVYAVKEAALLAPWADVLYAADEDWWTNNEDRWTWFEGRKVTVANTACQKYPELEYYAAKTGKIWSRTQGETATGGNAGFQTLNIATLELGDDPDPKESRIILLGYDYGFDPNKQDKHWWEKSHPRFSRQSNYKNWLKYLDAAAKFIPVPVFNASRLTAIKCFPQVSLEELLT